MQRADFMGREGKLRDRLVSVLFARPETVAIENLRNARVFWDAQTGSAWDLFFAGYLPFSTGTSSEQKTRIGGPGGKWWFDSENFVRLTEQFSSSHRWALPGAKGESFWRYSGKVDLVSMMAYGGDLDWLSLRSLTLTDSRGDYAEGRSLDEVIQVLKDWQLDEIHELDKRLAPGYEYRGAVVTPMRLAYALQWSASAVAGGVLGNAVYDIIGSVVGQ